MKLRGPIAAFAVVVVAACSKSSSNARSPYPVKDVQLSTDDMGITHVVGESDADAMFGAGYAMARDRLMQMEVYRRNALGTAAEILGPSSVRNDVAARAFDFKKLGVQDRDRVSRDRPGDEVLVEAWVAGVNARIDEVNGGRAPKPPAMSDAGLDRFAAWQPAEAYAIGKLLAFGLSNTLDQEILATALLRLAPDFVKNMPLALPSYDVFTTVVSQAGMPHRMAPPPVLTDVPRDHVDPSTFALWSLPLGGHSNNWAVSGAHTENGRPILAGDPHQALTSPSRFWPVHIKSTAGGGTLDVIGFAFPGAPGVQLGHNAKIGWTATTNYADVMDLWSVKRTVARDGVQLADGDHAISARDEIIAVRGADATTVTVEEVPGYGVLLPEALLPLPHTFLVDGDAILFNWTGFQATRELSAYLALDRAASVDEFEAAVDLLDVGAVNFVGADAQHVDYHVHAIVPDRGMPSSHPMPWRVLDGMDAASFWNSKLLGADKLPRLRDPDRGFIVTANNDPWGFTADGNVENDPFYYGTFYANGSRAERISEELTRLVGVGKVRRSDIEALQDDVHSIFADTVVPLVGEAIANVDSDASLAQYKGREDLKALARALVAWDRTMRRAKGEPLAFEGLLWFAAYRAFADKLPAALFKAIASKSPPYFLGQLRNVLAGRVAASSSFLPSGGARALLLGALDDTSKWLVARFGTSDVSGLSFGALNVAAFPVSLGQEPPQVPIDGFSDSVKVCEAPFFASTNVPADITKANEASLYRMVMMFDDDGVPNATIDFARGSREDPTDPHYADQESAWVDGKHASLAFRDADVTAHTIERATLAAKR